VIIEPTSSLVYLHGDSIILAQKCQTDAGFLRRLIVNGQPSPWKACYTGTLVHLDYGWADDNDETLPDGPFHITLMLDQASVDAHRRYMALLHVEGKAN